MKNFWDEEEDEGAAQQAEADRIERDLMNEYIANGQLTREMVQADPFAFAKLVEADILTMLRKIRSK